MLTASITKNELSKTCPNTKAHERNLQIYHFFKMDC